jgi:hypothetical protein
MPHDDPTIYIISIKPFFTYTIYISGNSFSAFKKVVVKSMKQCPVKETYQNKIHYNIETYKHMPKVSINFPFEK